MKINIIITNRDFPIVAFKKKTVIIIAEPLLSLAVLTKLVWSLIVHARLLVVLLVLVSPLLALLFPLVLLVYPFVFPFVVLVCPLVVLVCPIVVFVCPLVVFVCSLVALSVGFLQVKKTESIREALR